MHFPLLNISAAVVRDMPVVECNEPMLAIVGLHGRLLVDDSPDNHAHLGYTPNFSVRASVAMKLTAATDSLPSNIVMLVKESLRPAVVQEAFFQRRLSRLTAQHPAMQPQHLIELAARFIAPPWVAGHPSGGAIDVTLCDADYHELDLGCGYDEDEEASGGACLSGFTDLDPTAFEHRQTLFAALRAVGFVNYPFEWWHWSYGDRYWAAVSGKPHAIYGAV